MQGPFRASMPSVRQLKPCWAFRHVKCDIKEKKTTTEPQWIPGSWGNFQLQRKQNTSRGGRQDLLGIFPLKNSTISYSHHPNLYLQKLCSRRGTTRHTLYLPGKRPKCTPSHRSPPVLTFLLNVQVPFHGVGTDGLVLKGILLHLFHQRFHFWPGAFKAISCLGWKAFKSKKWNLVLISNNSQHQPMESLDLKPGKEHWAT